MFFSAEIHFSYRVHLPLSSIERPLQRQIPRTPSYKYTLGITTHNPILAHRVPIGDIPPGQLDLKRAALPGIKNQIVKTPQCYDGIRWSAQRDVQLRDLGAFHGAGIRDGRGDDVDHVVELAITARGAAGGEFRLGCAFSGSLLKN